MTFRISCNSDIKQIKALWYEAFGDDYSYIDFFMDNCYRYSVCLCAFDDNKLVSMLFLLQSSLLLKNKSYNSYYIYAACTTESQRNKGIMTRLLSYAKDYSMKNNVDALVLVPASKKLFDYYGKSGFCNCFYYKNCACNMKELINSTAYDTFDITEDEILALRKEGLKNSDCFLFSDNITQYAIKEHFYTNGKALGYKNNEACGYILYHNSNKNVIIDEMIPLYGEKKQVLYNICKKNIAENIYLHYKMVYNSIDFKFDCKPSSMIFFVKDIKIENELLKSVYFSLYLN